MFNFTGVARAFPAPFSGLMAWLGVPYSMLLFVIIALTLDPPDARMARELARVVIFRYAAERSLRRGSFFGRRRRGGWEGGGGGGGSLIGVLRSSLIGRGGT